MRLLCGVLFLCFVSQAAWGAEDLMKKAQGIFKALPKRPPILSRTPATRAKIELGKELYFDPRLSASQLISCNTCHNIGLGGADLQETSIGHGWQKGPRNAPTVLNAVFNIAQFWDGRAADLAAQAKGPIQASVEMNNKPERVMETLKSMPGYVSLFKTAFPGVKDPVTFDNTVKAIEAFEATLLTPDSPFDVYLNGYRNALNAREEKGLGIFMAKGCAACHNGLNVGGGGYYPFGVLEAPDATIRPPGDLGRYKVTNTLTDKYVFKAPTLRNIGLTAPYFHSGKVWKLKDAVAVMGSAQLGIKLSSDDEDAIVAFLLTLTGTQPRVEYPVLPAGSATTPLPIIK